jgi:hypothetical protein
MGQVRLG